MANTQKMRTAAELAELVGAVPETIQRLCRSGAIACINISTTGRRAAYRISHEEVERFLREGPRRPAAQSSPVDLNRSIAPETCAAM